MRKLYLKRKRAFTACLVSVSVYLTSSEQEATRTLYGYPCKKVASLRSGKTAVIELPDIACYVYVALASLSEEITEYFIPAGTEDVYLRTKPKMGFWTTKFVIEPMPAPEQKTETKDEAPQ